MQESEPLTNGIKICVRVNELLSAKMIYLLSIKHTL